MNLIKFRSRQDHGHEWYVQILNTSKHFPKFIKNKSLLQVSISWNDDPDWPYIQVVSGYGTLFSLLFWIYRFGLVVDILSRTWNYEKLEELDTILNEQEQ
jgi:hypothetical protein